MLLQERITLALQAIGLDIKNLLESNGGTSSFVQQIGGRYLLDPNEFVGLGTFGMSDDVATVDLGNVGADVSRLAGGFSFPFDVEILSFEAWHRNSNATAQAWGWRLIRQAKTIGSSAVTTTDILRECIGTGATAVAPRDYGSTATQRTIIDLTTGPSLVIPAGEVFGYGVEAPTAQTSNYYVEVMSGFFEFRKV